MQARRVASARDVFVGAIALMLWPLQGLAQRPTSAPAASPAPLTLDDALREARAANAQLPIAALGVTIARTEVREAQASRLPRLSLESGASVGGPPAYTTPQGQLQVVGTDAIYSGGLHRANLRAAQFRVQVAGAGFRIAEKDVDLAVRLRFAEFLKAEEEIAFRQQGIERLRSYLAQVGARRTAGQPVGSDVITTQVRVGTEEAVLADIERALDEARLELNDLMGRDPQALLALAALPPPAPPLPATGAPWLAAPENRQADASLGVAEAGIAAARAERRPQLAVSANLGALPVLGKDAGTGLFTGTGVGGAVVVSLSWPFWDAGGYRARLERAQVEAQQARDSQVVVQRLSRLSWQVADVQRIRLYAQVQAWARNVPLARDAYLQTASMYNGGAATALEVLDAYAAWINANDAYADAVLRYRQAEANALRWGTP